MNKILNAKEVMLVIVVISFFCGVLFDTFMNYPLVVKLPEPPKTEIRYTCYLYKGEDRVTVVTMFNFDGDLETIKKNCVEKYTSPYKFR